MACHTLLPLWPTCHRDNFFANFCQSLASNFSATLVWLAILVWLATLWLGHTSLQPNRPLFVYALESSYANRARPRTAPCPCPCPCPHPPARSCVTVRPGSGSRTAGCRRRGAKQVDEQPNRHKISMAPPHAWLRTHFCLLSAAAALATAAAEFDGAVAAGCCHGHAMPTLRRKGRRKTTKSGSQSPCRPPGQIHTPDSFTHRHQDTYMNPPHACMHTYAGSRCDDDDDRHDRLLMAEAQDTNVH